MILIEQTTVPVAALPVAEFKDHLRIGTGFADDAVQDSVLEICLRTAAAAIEARTGKALIARQFQLSLTAWRGRDKQPLPIAPVSSLLSLAILDRAGKPRRVPDSAYRLEADSQVPRLAAVRALPTIPDGGAAEIRFVAGYGDKFQAMPGDLLRALFILAADFYENRHSGAQGDGAFPFSVNALIEPHRQMRLGGVLG